MTNMSGMSGLSGITRMTWVTVITGKSGMTRMTRMTGETGMAETWQSPGHQWRLKMWLGNENLWLNRPMGNYDKKI